MNLHKLSQKRYGKCMTLQEDFVFHKEDGGVWSRDAKLWRSKIWKLPLLHSPPPHPCPTQIFRTNPSLQLTQINPVSNNYTREWFRT